MGNNRTFIPNLSGVAHPLVDEAIRNLYIALYKINPGGNVVNNNTTVAGASTTIISSTTGGGGGGGGGSTVLSTVQDFILSSGMTIVLAPITPTNPGDILGVWVQAKGKTGLFTWGPGIKHAPTALDYTTDTWTPFDFRARKDPADGLLKWFYIGPQPVSGQI